MAFKEYLRDFIYIYIRVCVRERKRERENLVAMKTSISN